MKIAEQITGENAGGPRQLAIRSRRVARVAKFDRWVREAL